jgi:hypothetical protein
MKTCARLCGRSMDGRTAGHRVEVMTHAAEPPTFHDLKDRIGLRTASQCAREALQAPTR